jgi:hypothetical protein
VETTPSERAAEWLGRLSAEQKAGLREIRDWLHMQDAEVRERWLSDFRQEMNKMAVRMHLRARRPVRPVTGRSGRPRAPRGRRVAAAASRAVGGPSGRPRPSDDSDLPLVPALAGVTR